MTIYAAKIEGDSRDFDSAPGSLNTGAGETGMASFAVPEKQGIRFQLNKI